MGLDDFGHNKPARWELTSKLSEDPSTWYIADFGFYGWPEAKIGSYMKFRQEALEVERTTPWRQKIPKLFWRGIPMTDQRMELFARTANQSWADVKEIDWCELFAQLVEAAFQREQIVSGSDNKSPVVPLYDHCRYKYLAGLSFIIASALS